MKGLRIVPLLGAGVVAAILAAGGVRANQQVAGQVITGYVTTAPGTDSIVIDGQLYNVAPGSPAEEELSSLSAGQRVDAQLDGPASSPDSQVINVAVHEGQ